MKSELRRVTPYHTKQRDRQAAAQCADPARKRSVGRIRQRQSGFAYGVNRGDCRMLSSGDILAYHFLRYLAPGLGQSRWELFFAF